jgi:hypothetical protein
MAVSPDMLRDVLYKLDEYEKLKKELVDMIREESEDGGGGGGEAEEVAGDNDAAAAAGGYRFDKRMQESVDKEVSVDKELQELKSLETSCDKIRRCRGKIEITGTGCQKVSFSMALLS